MAKKISWQHLICVYVSYFYIYTKSKKTLPLLVMKIWCSFIHTNLGQIKLQDFAITHLQRDEGKIRSWKQKWFPAQYAATICMPAQLLLVNEFCPNTGDWGAGLQSLFFNTIKKFLYTWLLLISTHFQHPKWCLKFGPVRLLLSKRWSLEGKVFVAPASNKTCFLVFSLWQLSNKPWATSRPDDALERGWIHWQVLCHTYDIS
jgi:hypothetical protein